jgi:alkylated DNA repair protein (DNA oxidative demethylase)
LAGYIGAGFFARKPAAGRLAGIFEGNAPMISPTISLGGFAIHKAFLDPAAQSAMAADVAGVAEAAPFFAPLTPWGKPLSVRMSSAGRYGWFTDRKGYRYIDRHPSGVPWPPIPPSVLAVWRALVPGARDPDCCLVNLYAASARMGLHRDADEKDFSFPVVSISLGDSGLFRIGGLSRKDPTSTVLLESGDVVVFGGDARLAYHGIDRIRAGSSRLLPEGGRINLTLRVVD